MTKAALGLFHFNVNYSFGDISSYHRYCVQAICPFLRTIDLDPQLRVTFEIAGTGLEFLALHYPEALTLLRHLIDRGQVELISSTYAPTFWAAFPLRDLRHSIAINRKVLARLDLKAANIFFSQEALFGYGIKAIADEFSVAVCRDDYIRCLTDGTIGHPILRMGSLDIVIGANHLASELSRTVNNKFFCTERFSLFHRERIALAKDKIPRSSPEAITGSVDDVSWYWYHLGNGHQFSTLAQPDARGLFFADRTWSMLNLQVIRRLIVEGYAPTPISEFCTMLSGKHKVEITEAYEGGWKPERSQGVYTWMGRHASPWENNSKQLGLVWRSRQAVRRLEQTLESSNDAEMVRSMQSDVEELWKSQIISEASDPLGWEPSLSEVESGVISAETTLLSALKLLRRANASDDEDLAAVLTRAAPSIANESFCYTPMLQTIGKSARIECCHIASNLVIVEIAFEMTDDYSGIQFLCDPSSLIYCPSGLEQQPRRIDLATLRMEELFLPLANGLLSLGAHQHLIRVNLLGQCAVRISKSSNWVDFAIKGPANGVGYQWQFVLLSGSIDEAVRLANEINHV